MFLIDILDVFENKKDNIAYSENDCEYTYKDLYILTKKIYNILLTKNKEYKPVIVYGHKEFYMKASFLACLFAGMTYVPIDNCLPEKRVEYIYSIINPDVIIKNGKINGIELDTENGNNIDSVDLRCFENKDFDLNSIAYIIFTSGSTGDPKGVQVTYKNLDTCINWLKKISSFTDKDVILNQAIFSFDLSVADLYLTTVIGAKHYILKDVNNLNLKEMFENLKTSNITAAVLTPSFADLLLLDKSFGREKIPYLKTIIFCGEKLLKSTVIKLKERFKDIKIINAYGPTECTFAVTSVEIEDKYISDLKNINDDSIPVGFVKDGVTIKIVDKNKCELKPYEKGEILIIGDSVAKGYINVNVDEDVFIKYNGENAYLTGDIGYLDENGLLYFESRKDTTVKYKGYRIDLLDIERNILKLDFIENVKVLDKKDENGKTVKIIAFIKLKTSEESNDNKESITKEKIKKELIKYIPEYMCPTIKIVEEFKLNNNGKVDLQELRSKINGK